MRILFPRLAFALSALSLFYYYYFAYSAVFFRLCRRRGVLPSVCVATSQSLFTVVSHIILSHSRHFDLLFFTRRCRTHSGFVKMKLRKLSKNALFSHSESVPCSLRCAIRIWIHPALFMRAEEGGRASTISVHFTTSSTFNSSSPAVAVVVAVQVNEYTHIYITIFGVFSYFGSAIWMRNFN